MLKITAACKIPFIGLIILFSSYATIEAKGIGILKNVEWGMKKAAVIKTFPVNTKFSKFKPANHPEYKNKIMNYITMVDMTSKKRLSVIKTKTTPEIEYLFLDNSLCCVVEDWKKISRKTELSIDRRLLSRYRKPHIKKDSNLHILSYRNQSTDVIYQKLYHNNGSIKCKIYYYTKKVFRILMKL